jgi:hypothetical protein
MKVGIGCCGETPNVLAVKMQSDIAPSGYTIVATLIGRIHPPLLAISHLRDLFVGEVNRGLNPC